jgi:hypothetical protein
VTDFEMDAEVVAEEDAPAGDATQPVRPLPAAYEEPGRSALPVLRPEVRTAVVAAAGGVLAGAATVAAVRAVAAVGSKPRSPRRIVRRRADRPNIVASRSFLVDVHLLGR